MAAPAAASVRDEAAATSKAGSAPEKAPAPSPRPPRFSGWFLRADLGAGLAFARVRDLDTPDPFAGPAGDLAVGQVILPYLALGLRLVGHLGWAGSDGTQRLGQGAVLLDGTFRPLPRRQLWLRASLGVGGGAVRERGLAGRSGFGGPVFGLGAAYAFYPAASRYRPRRAGGFFVAPHLDYVVATPAARGRPMAHTLVAGVSLGFHFGE